MTAVAAVALTCAGFIFGWTVADDSHGERNPEEWPDQVATTPEQVPARNLSLPSEDVAGEEIEGLPRYPGSVRIEYVYEDQGKLIWTETEYLTDASLEETREFYRDTFRAGNWSVNDVGFTQNSWVFFVVDGEREVFVNLRPRGEIVEIDIEHTEPDTTDQAREDGGTPSDPQETSQQAAPQQAAPQQAIPVYDDDYDDDDYEFDDDYDD